MEYNMIDVYKKLNINDKRNEFSTLLMKMDNLLNSLILQENLKPLNKVKNYDLNKDFNLSESDALVFFYEDVWNLKNKILLLTALESKKKKKTKDV